MLPVGLNIELERRVLDRASVVAVEPGTFRYVVWTIVLAVRALELTSCDRVNSASGSTEYRRRLPGSCELYQA